MAEISAPTSPYFNLTYPLPYVAHVEINRPEKLNAFIEPMWLALPPLFSYLSSSPSIRTIIISGTGTKAFSAGLDTTAAFGSGPLAQSPTSKPSSSQQSPSPNTTPSNTYSQPTGTPYTTQAPPPPPSTSPQDPARIARSLITHITTFQTSLTALEKCAKPVIAILHGYCYGLGIDLSLCADVRICTSETRFSVKEVDIGIAADVGTLTRLGKATGNESWVKDVCLSAREFGAKEALERGFVSKVVGAREGAGATERAGGSKEVSEKGDLGKDAAMEEALRWAGLVAEKSPVAVQGTKELLNWSRDRSVEDGLRYAAVWNGAMLQTGDLGRAVEAGRGKGRRARFEKL